MPDGGSPNPAAGTASTSSLKTLRPRLSAYELPGVQLPQRRPHAGPGGKQILLEDPSGNPIELFQPAAS